MSVLDVSAKEKSAKPPRRLSIPAKSTVNSVPKSVGNITPISEIRAKRSASTQGKSETPLSDVSRASSRKKFSVLSSASYWLSQIKLSESAAKHSISLGFFKLALEAGCEVYNLFLNTFLIVLIVFIPRELHIKMCASCVQPLQRMRDELKSYARRHNIGELGEPVKDLFDLYNISEATEQLQVSETCSQVPEEGIRSSDEEVHSSSSTMGTRKLKPKSLNTYAAQVSSVSESVKKETAPKISPSNRTRASKNTANAKPVSDVGNRKIEKKPQKPTKLEANKKDRNIKPGKKSASQEGKHTNLFS